MNKATIFLISVLNIANICLAQNFNQPKTEYRKLQHQILKYLQTEKFSDDSSNLPSVVMLSFVIKNENKIAKVSKVHVYTVNDTLKKIIQKSNLQRVMILWNTLVENIADNTEYNVLVPVSIVGNDIEYQRQYYTSSQMEQVLSLLTELNEKKFMHLRNFFIAPIKIDVTRSVRKIQ